MNAALVAVLSLAAVAQAIDQQESPIGKVIQLLSDLEAKVIREGEDAQKVYSQFAEWCEDRSRNLGFSIKDGKSASAELQATIEQEEALIASTGTKIEELASSIATDEADLKAASTIRQKEVSDFQAEEKELTEVIDTLERATAILSREMQKGGAAMLQLRDAKNVADALKIMVDASAMNSADASKLTALLQDSQSAGDADAGAPDASIYESHSSNIVDTLQSLQDKAEEQLNDARKKESTAANNFELLKQSLEDSIRFANGDMSKAKHNLAQSQESRSAAEGDLSITTESLRADENQLADLHRECMTKSEDFEAETKSRGEELKALAEAKRVIQSTTGGAEQVTYGLSQVSFLQRARISSAADLARYEALRLVRDLARKENSRSLAQLASRMSDAMHSSSGSEDPFAKVKGLINDMLDRLQDQAAADATEKAYCDKELSETEEKKADKTAEIEKMTTQIDKMSARSSTLKEEVAALQKALADLASSQAEMTKMRNEEHSLFVSNKADMEQGVNGVKLALKILREYYASDKSHSAAEGAGSGIIGLLEVCESDFSKGLAEIVATEESAQTAYDTETKENQIEKATKEQDVKYKTKESVSLDKAVAETNSDRSGVQAELDAVMEYLAKLRERCIAKAQTYAERVARREAELAGLKSALEILETQAALIQTKSLRRQSKRATKL